MNNSLKQKQIQHNKTLHDHIASEYDDAHIEIYNSTEQSRISTQLLFCTSLLNTKIQALDFGAGTGNLTKHLLDLDVDVTACDVSEMSLNRLAEKFNFDIKLKTDLINGINLNCYPDNSFNLVVTYSVLHHVPDYLKAVEEMIRVLEIGGILYIDHEVCTSYWEDNDVYNQYINELNISNSISIKSNFLLLVKKIFSFSAWKRYYNRVFFGLNEEGDIHVTKEDHIEWDKLEEIINLKCKTIKAVDYLVCRESTEDRPIHKKYEDKCNDMRFLIAQKISN